MAADPFHSRDGLQTQTYDQLTVAEWESTQNDIPFYLEEAGHANGPVLELGCGTGRLLVPLLSTGLEVSGLDASTAMLQLAKQKQEQLPAIERERLRLHRGDMSKFELGQQFALIFVAFRSFQFLLTPAAQQQCLACIRKHLLPKGKAIINLFDPRYDLIIPGKRKSVSKAKDLIHPTSGHHVLVETLERDNDPLSQTFKERWRFTETDAGGAMVRQEEGQLQMRWTFRYEMRHLVEGCGFVVAAEYSDFQRSPPAYGKEQIWVLSQNPSR
jgi:SAM-dependent methyltransferase